jgi:hypothetical protein
MLVYVGHIKTASIPPYRACFRGGCVQGWCSSYEREREGESERERERERERGSERYRQKDSAA